MLPSTVEARDREIREIKSSHIYELLYAGEHHQTTDEEEKQAVRV